MPPMAARTVADEGSSSSAPGQVDVRGVVTAELVEDAAEFRNGLDGVRLQERRALVVSDGDVEAPPLSKRARQAELRVEAREVDGGGLLEAKERCVEVPLFFEQRRELEHGGQ